MSSERGLTLILTGLGLVALASIIGVALGVG